MSAPESGTALSSIVGMGTVGLTRDDTPSAHELCVRAMNGAIDESGMKRSEIDGLLMARSPVAPEGWLSRDLEWMKLQREAGLQDLRLYHLLQAGGSSVNQMVQTATQAIRRGAARSVLCVYADTPLMQSESGGKNYGNVVQLFDLPGLEGSYGLFGAPAAYAMAARRHMAVYGTTTDQLGAVARSNRAWARMNPDAVMDRPLSMDDYRDSRWIVEPFHLLDCAIPVNGGIAVLVTSTDRAKDVRTDPVHVVGFGQGHPGAPHRSGYDGFVHTGARQAGQTAFSMAGITVHDVDMCQLYDPFTYVTIVTLEDYGFCEKGEGGAFVGDGHTRPGGSLPTSTGGGHLSGFYLEGMTPLSEAVIQIRGDAGERQVEDRDVVLVSNSGGYLEYHSTLLLSPLRSLHG